MATSNIEVTAGTGTKVATHTISEDAATKHLTRHVLEHSDGSALSDATGVKISTSQLAALATSQQAFSAGAQGVYVPSDHPDIPVRSPIKYVTVDMTAETTALDLGDVVAATQVVAACTPANDVRAILHSMTLIDPDDQGAKLRIVLFDANTTLGTEDSAPDIDDTEAQTIIGMIDIATTDYVDLGANKIVHKSNLGIVVNPASGTDDIYMAIYTPDTSTPTYAGGHIYVRMGFIC